MAAAINKYEKEIRREREENRLYWEALTKLADEEEKDDLSKLRNHIANTCGGIGHTPSALCKMGIHKFRGRTTQWCFEGWCLRCGKFNRDYNAGWGI